VETAILFGAANHDRVQSALRLADIALTTRQDVPPIDLGGDYPRMEAGRKRIYCRTADIGDIARITTAYGGYVWLDNLA